MKNAAKLLFWIGILAALAGPAFAETRTVSWEPVTAYTDGTPIEAVKTVSYSVYWTTDPGLGSLRNLGASLATTSTTFDPSVQGMTPGGTVYFTAKAVLNTGEESALSPAYPWVVPVIAPLPAVLTSITVSGPSSVNEGATATYTATGTWDNGTTAAISPAWSENSAYATISSGGVLTASAVTANQAATVTASYGGRTGTTSVTIVDVPATLSSITVSGPSSVSEGATATYTATAAWSDGTNSAVTPAWSASLGTISGTGQFTAPSVTANQSGTIGASYTYGGVTRTAALGVSVVDGSATLSSISVSGPSSVNEGGTATYTATGTWDNGTTAAVAAAWSVSASYASISSAGVLTGSTVTSNQAVTVTAAFGGKTGAMGVTIVDVSGPGPAEPRNLGIATTSSAAAPYRSAPTTAAETWRIKWDPVSTYRDGTPIGPGRTVRYTAYWTDDPALSPASLRPLASLLSTTVLDFDPAANGMSKNQVVFLTVRTVLDTGDQSSLAASLTWRVENAGPAPVRGKIIRK